MLFHFAQLLKPLGLQAEPAQRRFPTVCRRLAGAGDPPQLLYVQTGLTLGSKQLDGRRAAQRQEAVEAGLLTVNTVHQLLAQAVAELAAGKAQCSQRALLTHQLFSLHKAVQGDHTPGYRRVVNTVIELRDDIQQMADNTAELLRRGFSGYLPAADLLTQRRELRQIAYRPGDAPAQRAAGDRARPFEGGIEQGQPLINQRPTRPTLRRVQLAARAKKNIRRPALALQHMHQRAELTCQLAQPG